MLNAKKINIAIGSDHRGFDHKEYIKKQEMLCDNDVVNWIDVGAHNHHRSDYPIFGQAVSKMVQEGDALYGVLLCGTGAGMAIVANRYHGVYAALVWNEITAQLSKEHDNANVLVIPADFVSHEQSIAMLRLWLQSSFLKGRYYERFIMIDRGQK